MGRIEPAVGVFPQPEYGRALAGVVCAHTLEYGQTIMQRVSQDVGCGVAPRNQFAVVPDETIAIRHRHNALQKVRLHCSKSSPLQWQKTTSCVRAGFSSCRGLRALDRKSVV